MRFLLLLLLIGVVAYFVMNSRVTPKEALLAPKNAAEGAGSAAGPGERVGRAVDWALHQTGKAAEEIGEVVQSRTSNAARAGTPAPTRRP